VNFSKMLKTVLYRVFTFNAHPINRLSKAGAALVNTISSSNISSDQSEMESLKKTRKDAPEKWFSKLSSLKKISMKCKVWLGDLSWCCFLALA